MSQSQWRLQQILALSLSFHLRLFGSSAFKLFDSSTISSLKSLSSPPAAFLLRQSPPTPKLAARRPRSSLVTLPLSLRCQCDGALPWWLTAGKRPCCNHSTAHLANSKCLDVNQFHFSHPPSPFQAEWLACGALFASADPADQVE